MKFFFVIVFAGFLVHAENADTVINVNKGHISDTSKFEMHEGTDEISGETNVLKKTAQNNWKAACTEWTKEFKEKNKDRIVSFSCGKMNCTKEGVESTCTSTAKYKIRVLTEQGH